MASVHAIATLGNRVPSSMRLAALALGVSLAVHFGGLALRGAPVPIQVAGGGTGAIAMQGNSFSDMTAGVTEPTESETAEKPTAPPETPESPTETAERPPPIERTVDPETPTSSPITTPSLTRVPTESLMPVSTVPEPSETVSASDAPRPPTETLEPVPEEEVVDTLTTKRPRTRPPEIAQKARETQPDPPVQHEGNSNATARRGSAGGAQNAQAVSAGPGASSAAGNAAASNYPGIVQQKIARQRLPRIAAAQTLWLRFTVSSTGRLEQISVRASSGDPRFDRAGLELVKRASPFPPPPPGANRTFNIPLRWQPTK